MEKVNNFITSYNIYYGTISTGKIGLKYQITKNFKTRKKLISLLKVQLLLYIIKMKESMEFRVFLQYQKNLKLQDYLLRHYIMTI